MLLSYANRLLKNRFPGSHTIHLHEYLVKSAIVLPKNESKKFIENLPVPTLEKAVQVLWQKALGYSGLPQDQWFTLFLLWRQLVNYRWEALLEQDLGQLGKRDTGVIHSFYYGKPILVENLQPVLQAHGYRTDWLLPSNEHEPVVDELSSCDQQQAIRYLICRKLSFFLPWQALLQLCNQEDFNSYPRLRDAQAVFNLLKTQAQTACEVAFKDTFHFGQLLSHCLKQTSLDTDGQSNSISVFASLNLLLLVEGETEKLLLPVLGKVAGINFQAAGIQILPAGGKNHVPALYQQESAILNCPILVLLDRDAESIEQTLKPQCRTQDRVFVLPQGEFEDTYHRGLLINLINEVYKPYPLLTEEALANLESEQQASGVVSLLKALWQAQQWGSFDKISFAQHYAQQFQALQQAEGVACISQPLQVFFDTLSQMLASYQHRVFD